MCCGCVCVVCLFGFNALTLSAPTRRVPSHRFARLDGGPAVGCVSSFGFGGANAHLVMQSFDEPGCSLRAKVSDLIAAEEQGPRRSPESQPSVAAAPRLCICTARSETALEQRCGQGAEMLRGIHFLQSPDGRQLDVDDALYSINGITRLEKRCVAIGRSCAELADAFTTPDSKFRALATSTATLKPSEHGIAFVFSGMGTQWPGSAARSHTPPHHTLAARSFP